MAGEVVAVRNVRTRQVEHEPLDLLSTLYYQAPTTKEPRHTSNQCQAKTDELQRKPHTCFSSAVFTRWYLSICSSVEAMNIVRDCQFIDGRRGSRSEKCSDKTS